MAQQQWMIYGANGYTGRLLVEQAVAEGLKPFLAGRDRDTLKAMSDQLCLPFRAFELSDVKSVAEALEDIDVLVNCAGPFSATAALMAEACIFAGTHYVDITGEIDVFEDLKGLGERAIAAKVTLLPGAGFDVVATDCLAAHLHRELPEATHLQLGFCGEGGTSPGTLKTMVELLAKGGRVRRGGKISKVPAGYRQKGIVFSDGRRRHCMTIPWGDISTAFRSTGIQDIRVYTAVPLLSALALRVLSPLLMLLRFPPLRNWLKHRIASEVSGPNAQQRAQGCMRLWGEVRDEQGECRVAWLDVPEGYQFTVISCLRVVKRVLQGDVQPGFQTPSVAFGAEFVTTLPGCQFADPSSGDVLSAGQS